MDGLTCDWPRPREWKLWALAFSVPGMLLSVLAWRDKSWAKLALATTIVVMATWGLVDAVIGQLYFDYAPLRLDEKLTLSCVFVLAVLLFYLYFATAVKGAE